MRGTQGFYGRSASRGFWVVGFMGIDDDRQR